MQTLLVKTALVQQQHIWRGFRRLRQNPEIAYYLLVMHMKSVMPGQHVAGQVFFSKRVILVNGIHMEKLNIAHLSSRGIVINSVLSA